MINKSKLTFLSLLVFSFLFSCKKDEHILPPAPQSSITENIEVHSCSSDEFLKEQLMNDPGMKARMEAIELDIQQRLSGRSSLTTGSVVTIPVVVHIVYNTTEQNISDPQIQSQIDVLNEDFSRQNADALNTPGYFQPFAANTNIQFVLAKQDPNGNSTTGITRTNTSVASFTTNGYVKYNIYGGKDPWNTTQYLNIWVCNLGGFGGYSTMPGASAATDGVVVNYICFGRTGTGTLMSEYNKGRTTTHEVGHWFGLRHIWGATGTCGDDGVADTPTQEKANSGIPVFPHVSACSPDSNGDMFMSYMDYSNDAARNMFSIGQSERMNANLYGYRASLLTSLGGVSPGSTTPEICNVPTGLAASTLSSTGANLNWTSTGASSYNVRYKPTASATWINTTATSTSVAASGLTPSTSYEFQVASICSGTSISTFAPSVIFTTTAASGSVCNVPVGLFASSITNKTASLNWASSGAVTYTVRYKLLTSGSWITVTTASTSLPISGLSAFKKYEFQVAGNCSSSSSVFSTSTIFTTAKNGKNA